MLKSDLGHVGAHRGLACDPCLDSFISESRPWHPAGCAISMAIARTESAWLTRAFHQVNDVWKVVTFGLPLHSLSTSLRVGGRVLHLRQWSGSKVGSGGFLWGASRRLVHYMEAHGDGSPALPPSADGSTLGAPAVASRPLWGLKLLELGSGTGGAGIAAAVLGAHVTMTDQASYVYPGGPQREQPTVTLLDLARTNVELNAPLLLECARAAASAAAAHTTAASAPAAADPAALAAGTGLRQHPSPLDVVSSVVSSGSSPAPLLPVVAKLLWGDAADLAGLPHPKYGIIAGADVLLFVDAHEGLLRTLEQLASATTVVLIEHTDRGKEAHEYPCDLLLFLKRVAAEGRWKPTVVRDSGRHITIRMVHVDAPW